MANESQVEVQSAILRRIARLLEAQNKTQKQTDRAGRVTAEKGGGKGTNTGKQSTRRAPDPSASSKSALAGAVKQIAGVVDSIVNAGQDARNQERRTISGFTSDDVADQRARFKASVNRKDQAGSLKYVNPIFRIFETMAADQQRAFNKQNDPFQRTQGGIRSKVGGAISEFAGAGGEIDKAGVEALIGAVAKREENITKVLKIMEDSLSSREVDFYKKPEMQAIMGRK